MLKDIVKNLEPSSTLKMNEISKHLEEKGKKIFRFGFGQSPFQVPIDIVNELKKNAHQNKYLPIISVELRRSPAVELRRSPAVELRRSPAVELRRSPAVELRRSPAV